MTKNTDFCSKKDIHVNIYPCILTVEPILLRKTHIGVSYSFWNGLKHLV